MNTTTGSSSTTEHLSLQVKQEFLAENFRPPDYTATLFHTDGTGVETVLKSYYDKNTPSRMSPSGADSVHDKIGVFQPKRHGSQHQTFPTVVNELIDRAKKWITQVATGQSLTLDEGCLATSPSSTRGLTLDRFHPTPSNDGDKEGERDAPEAPDKDDASYVLRFDDVRIHSGDRTNCIFTVQIVLTKLGGLSHGIQFISANEVMDSVVPREAPRDWERALTAGPWTTKREQVEIEHLRNDAATLVSLFEHRGVIFTTDTPTSNAA